VCGPPVQPRALSAVRVRPSSRLALIPLRDCPARRRPRRSLPRSLPAGSTAGVCRATPTSTPAGGRRRGDARGRGRRCRWCWNRSVRTRSEEDQEDHHRQDRKKHCGSDHSLTLLGAPLSGKRRLTGPTSFLEAGQLALVTRLGASALEVTPISARPAISWHERER
jgi:hypothetical protein